MQPTVWIEVDDQNRLVSVRLEDGARAMIKGGPWVEQSEITSEFRCNPESFQPSEAFIGFSPDPPRHPQQ